MSLAFVLAFALQSCMASGRPSMLNIGRAGQENSVLRSGVL